MNAENIPSALQATASKLAEVNAEEIPRALHSIVSQLVELNADPYSWIPLAVAFMAVVASITFAALQVRHNRNSQRPHFIPHLEVTDRLEWLIDLENIGVGPGLITGLTLTIGDDEIPEHVMKWRDALIKYGLSDDKRGGFQNFDQNCGLSPGKRFTLLSCAPMDRFKSRCAWHLINLEVKYKSPYLDRDEPPLEIEIGRFFYDTPEKRADAWRIVCEDANARERGLADLYEYIPTSPEDEDDPEAIGTQ